MAALRKEKAKPVSSEPHDQIPFACHLNAQTVITKNVELIQIIKITGRGGLGDDQFRENLKEVLNEHINPAKFAVWIHTLRARKNVVETGREDFIKHVDVLWKQALPDELKFANTVYISLVRDFAKFSLLKPQNYLRSLIRRLEEGRFNRVIEEHDEELTIIADGIISALKKFKAKKLEIVQRNGIYYSEPAEFLHKLLTFSDARIPVRLGDMSRNLYAEEFRFNFYTGQVETVGKNGRSFGTVLTIKETSFLKASALMELLNTNYEIVISEAIDFALGNQRLPKYRYQKYVNSLSDDRQFTELMGGNEINPQEEDFAAHQLNIFISRKTPKELALAVNDINRKLSDLGIIAYIEDLALERSFWSILPGNFSFLRRQGLVAKSEIAGFACLGVDKFASIDGCMFGEPVTFFETAEGQPYALHFLNEGQSNILITGGVFEERQVICNLIASEAAKFGINIVFYDESGRFEGFAQSLGAQYLTVLDLDVVKESITDKTLIIINSLQNLVEHDNLDYMFNFLDHAAAKNAEIIALAEYSDNCEALLPNFRTQIFLHGDAEGNADHFDLFEDELKIIDLLDPDNFYFKHEFDELILRFRPSERLIMDLLEGDGNEQ